MCAGMGVTFDAALKRKNAGKLRIWGQRDIIGSLYRALCT